MTTKKTADDTGDALDGNIEHCTFNVPVFPIFHLRSPNSDLRPPAQLPSGEIAHLAVLIGDI
jgi:hypothetical protein